jgi:hypothetical protein
MSDFAFEVNIIAVVRVRAADENVALKVVPTVLGAPADVEIRLANENNAALGHHAIISNVDFSFKDGSITLFEIDGSCVPSNPAIRSPRLPTARRISRLTAGGGRESTPK